MVTSISHSPTETEALGEAWGRVAQSGLVLGLSGDLGAGKTQLVKGLARGLGITQRVHSPTFALVNIYTGGRLTLFHLDLYRLETREQILAAGLEEFLTPDGVTVIEWAERWFGNAPTENTGVRWAKIEALSEMERRITYEDIGA
jgi:tRNA threonylcarbamoyladenosine biosynthesis protein TsaE